MFKNKKTPLLLLLFCVFFVGFEVPSEGMTSSENAKCHYIIHSAATAAAGSAIILSQLPTTENTVLMGILTKMAISLGEVFSVELNDDVAAQMASEELSGFLLAKFFKMIPQWSISPVVADPGRGVVAVAAIALVESVGWSIADKFDQQ